MSELQLKQSAKHDAIWPAVVITFGISLTVIWVAVLGYGLFKLIELSI